MSLSRYLEYKDSGVEWLGEVPGHWYMRSLRYAATIQNGSDFKDCEVAEGGFPVLGSGGEFARISKFIYDQPSVLLGRKGTIDNPLYIEEPFWTVDTLFYTKIAADMHPKYFYWFCTSIPFDYFQFGSAVPSMTQNDLYGIKLPTPSFEEQQTIAAFLDRETRKIDALIAEQRRLVELLAEKRQAVISHAVTKGLNPSARMKDSGIEWLGVVPEHWEVGPLKRYWSVTDCKHVTAEFVEDGIPLASIREVQSRWVLLEDAKCTTEYFYELLIEGGRRPLPGDLIFSRNATVGEVAQVSGNHPRFAMGQDVVLLRKLAPEYSSDYLQHVIRSPIIILQLANMMIGSTFKRINVEEIRSFAIPAPPFTEQAEIAAFLESETAKFDTLTAEANRAIALLQERRSALISAAVTGKIDVRHAVTPAQAGVQSNDVSA